MHQFIYTNFCAQPLNTRVSSIAHPPAGALCQQEQQQGGSVGDNPPPAELLLLPLPETMQRKGVKRSAQSPAGSNSVECTRLQTSGNLG